MSDFEDALMKQVQELKQQLAQAKEENGKLKEENEKLKKQPGDAKQSGDTGGATGSPQQSKKREALKAVASPATGHVAGFSAKPKVTITKISDGSPVKGLLVRFLISDPGSELGTGYTDENGVAEAEISSFSPVDWAAALLRGYDGIFDGNAEYESVQAHNTIRPSV